MPDQGFRHILQGAVGEHVSKTQAALFILVKLSIDAGELSGKRYGPSTARAVPLMLGPTGNLRASLVRKGRTILVGFEEAMHRTVLEHGS